MKLQYPHLERQVWGDVWTLKILSRALEWYDPDYRYSWLIPEFAQTLDQELDETYNETAVRLDLAALYGVPLSWIQLDATAGSVVLAVTIAPPPSALATRAAAGTPPPASHRRCQRPRARRGERCDLRKFFACWRAC